ncbi:hypothetical protein QR77_03290 [Streptomyces sp. 150FB]|nr:hypothetical protein QR77_03290 [Streptomyces sp. 150FB]
MWSPMRWWVIRRVRSRLLWCRVRCRWRTAPGWWRCGRVRSRLLRAVVAWCLCRFRWTGYGSCCRLVSRSLW